MCPFFHRAVDLTARVLVCGVLPLVIQLFALAEGDLDLHAGILQIDGNRNNRVAVELDLLEQAHDLALMHQQAARAHRVFVEDVALLIGADVHLTQPELTVLDLTPCVLEVQRAETNGLDLRAEQLDAGLEAFLNKIFVKRLLVFRNDLDALAFHSLTTCQIYYITSVNASVSENKRPQRVDRAQIARAVLAHGVGDLRLGVRPAGAGEGDADGARHVQPGAHIVDHQQLLRPKGIPAHNVLKGKGRGLSLLGRKLEGINAVWREAEIALIIPRDVLPAGMRRDADQAALRAEIMQQRVHAFIGRGDVRADIDLPEFKLLLRFLGGQVQKILTHAGKGAVEDLEHKFPEGDRPVWMVAPQFFDKRGIIDGLGTADDGVVVIEHQTAVMHRFLRFCFSSFYGYGTSESIGCGVQRAFCPSNLEQNSSLAALAIESELPYHNRFAGALQGSEFLTKRVRGHIIKKNDANRPVRVISCCGGW